MEIKTQYGRILKMSELRKLESADPKPMIWTLWYLDSNEEDHFIASFPTVEEAREYIAEGLGHLRRASWRYCVEGMDPRSLKTVCGE